MIEIYASITGERSIQIPSEGHLNLNAQSSQKIAASKCH